MKVFQINTVSNWGATGRIVEGIGEKILECGGKGFIAYGRHNNESLLQTIKIGTNTDIYIHVLQTRLFDKHGLASKSATLRLIRQIVDIGPDVIHLHNIHGYYLNYKVLFRFLSKIDIPVVWTLHDCWPFTGHCSYYSFTYACVLGWRTSNGIWCSTSFQSLMTELYMWTGSQIRYAKKLTVYSW